jgi:hypothetical protein
MTVMTPIVPDLLTIALALVAVVAAVEVLRHTWALAICRREVRRSDALRRLRDPQAADVSGAAEELDRVSNESTRAEIAAIIWRLLLAIFALSWTIWAAWRLLGV